jgi:hypothetical protein
MDVFSVALGDFAQMILAMPPSVDCDANRYRNPGGSWTTHSRIVSPAQCAYHDPGHGLGSERPNGIRTTSFGFFFRLSKAIQPRT